MATITKPFTKYNLYKVVNCGVDDISATLILKKFN